LYYLDVRGLSDRDLIVSIGSQAEVNAILNKERPLTLDMIRRLNQDLGITAEILIQPYTTSK